MSNKRYPEEFKIEAARQIVEEGHSVASVAERLGVTTHSLYEWKKKFGPDSAEHQAKWNAPVLWPPGLLGFPHFS